MSGLATKKCERVSDESSCVIVATRVDEAESPLGAFIRLATLERETYDTSWDRKVPGTLKSSRPHENIHRHNTNGIGIIAGCIPYPLLSNHSTYIG